MKTMLLAAMAALLLAGCAGGPGKGEVEEAVRAFVEQTGGNTKLEELEVGECKEASGRAGYACSVTGRATIRMAGHSQATALVGTFVLEEIGGQWKVTGRL
ncbi:hypothetical protein QFW77_14655 [Luteimonas sp. RD2P54]|uniref:Lipoprotein n=1 Tax=Luteimonas endophytica TaxID=3042023 RepID=A0ABT6JBN5_9GAMM|nr:hypothetical protein [Luteimonas endophytica]MDH5824219.1 hypothetical protein [Luteimonas endophytica]